MSRDLVLSKIRSALGRSPGQAPQPAPPSLLTVPAWDRPERVRLFIQAFEKLGGKAHRATDKTEAHRILITLLENRSAVASNAAFLNECGVTRIPNLRSGIFDRKTLRAACVEVDVGVTSADYLLADTGTLVMLASRSEARLISLLPPMHVALAPVDRMLANLDELLSTLPQPAEQTSSMVLITGPSRTADIEQILVRGVHGPGEIHAILVET
jgi:L-lactate dehydrogenase complex protein LldG